MSLDKIAIVGMDAIFGECNGLDAFERSIYDGKQHFIELPPKRWYGLETQTHLLQGYGLPSGQPPTGAYIQDFEIDTFAYKIPPNELEKLNPQQLLLLKVADRALKDANITPGGNVAVIIAAETEFSVHQLQQRWNLSWQIADGLNAAEIALSSEQVAQLETIVKDAVHHQVEIGEYLSYIANIMASRISALWDFTGPAFTLTAVETSVFKALEVAQMLLVTGEVDAVVVGAVDLAAGVENVLLRHQWSSVNTGEPTLSYDQKANGFLVGEGAGAVVLKGYDAALANGDTIYAVIDALSIGQAATNTVAQVCHQALQLAGVEPSQVNYVEVHGSGVPGEDEVEIAGLLAAYPSVGDGLHCALGSVKANIGHTFVASGIASLIKTALCLYHRYIPATPNWSGVKTPELWLGSPFYVACESRPWFVAAEGIPRVAAVNGMGCDGSFAHVILSEQPNQQERTSRYLQQMPFYLLPVAFDEQAHLSQVLHGLKESIEGSGCLSTTATEVFRRFAGQSGARYVLAITGRNKKELLREIESAHVGVNNAFERSSDWQTPAGSYFTPKPLANEGAVAYVYPAAVNSYVGIGQHLFRLFPKLYDDTIFNSLAGRAVEIHRRLYPRSLHKHSTRQLESLEKQLLDDSLAMFETEIAYSRLITTILRDDFQVQPQSVFGYSLGETSMMSAQGVWSNFHGGSNTLNSSPLFGDRLSGRKNAVREFWGLTDSEDNNLWATYVLMASPQQVRECLKHEQRVYLTQINTPEEVLIAGEPAACSRVIQALGCNAFAAPFDHVIHCQVMRSEYEEIQKVNTLPSQNIPGIVFYSAANYQPIAIDSQTISKSIAQSLCQELDFPRLVNRVYEDGARIFIEAGAGSVCSRWISKILADKQHLTVSLNRRGMNDHTSIVKALAKLVSHQVALDLSPLYVQNSATTNSSTTTLRRVTLGGDSFTEKILTDDNRQLFSQMTSQLIHNSDKTLHSALPHFQESQIINSLRVPSHHLQLGSNTHASTEEVKMKNIIDNGFEFKEQLQSTELTEISQQITQPIFSLPDVNQELGKTINMFDLNKSQYQKLNANNLKITKAHTTFLQARHDFSKQMSEIIQLQLACAQNLLEEES